MNNTAYVGMDVHKNEHVVAVYAPQAQEPEVFSVTNRPEQIRKLARKLLANAPGPVEACYEAGVLGFSLKRQLEGLKIRCRVIAPSLIPVQPGQRVQTDHRDAKEDYVVYLDQVVTHCSTPNAGRAIRPIVEFAAKNIDPILVKHRVTLAIGGHHTGYERVEPPRPRPSRPS